MGAFIYLMPWPGPQEMRSIHKSLVPRSIGTQSSPVLMEVLKIATFLENWTCVDAVRVWAIASSNDYDALNKYILHGTVYHCASFGCSMTLVLRL